MVIFLRITQKHNNLISLILEVKKKTASKQVTKQKQYKINIFIIPFLYMKW